MLTKKRYDDEVKHWFSVFLAKNGTMWEYAGIPVQ